METKDLILKVVHESPGIKGPALVTRVALACHKSDDASLDDPELPPISDILESLVKDGFLVEVKYTTPSIPCLIKSVYFPGGAEISVRGDCVLSTGPRCWLNFPATRTRPLLCATTGHEMTARTIKRDYSLSEDKDWLLNVKPFLRKIDESVPVYHAGHIVSWRLQPKYE